MGRRKSFEKAAEVINAPLTLEAGCGFAYPQTRGERPPYIQRANSVAQVAISGQPARRTARHLVRFCGTGIAFALVH